MPIGAWQVTEVCVLATWGVENVMFTINFLVLRFRSLIKDKLTKTKDIEGVRARHCGWEMGLRRVSSPGQQCKADIKKKKREGLWPSFFLILPTFTL